MLYDDGRYSGVCIPAARCQSHVWVLVWVNIVTRLILLSCLTSPTVSCCSWDAHDDKHISHVPITPFLFITLIAANIESDWIAEIRSFCIE